MVISLIILLTNNLVYLYLSNFVILTTNIITLFIFNLQIYGGPQVPLQQMNSTAEKYVNMPRQIKKIMAYQKKLRQTKKLQQIKK